MVNSYVTVRMYDVGFGDAFLITAMQEEQSWRMLVDCGVHNQGKARDFHSVVRAIINDLAEAAPPGKPPSLDVVVATHHHADHIAGFSYDDWESVCVGEVWVPFVEDESDEDAARLKHGLTRTVQNLNTLINRSLAVSGDARHASNLELAGALAINSFGNQDAMDRLLGRNGKHFLNVPRVRYLPYKALSGNVLRTGLQNVNVHVLGPSRDPEQLKRMNPPTSARWLAMQQALDEEPTDESALDQGVANPIFDAIYAVDADEANHHISRGLLNTLTSLNLQTLLDDTSEILAAASILERSVNNTSIFFVLDVDGTRLVFVGDSQQGAWEHVLRNPAARALISEPAFYKIGHHGSHNATPRDYIAHEIGKGETYAMLPYGKVERWGDIPNKNLLSAFVGKHTHVVRSDAPEEGARVRVGPDNLWSEITFPTNMPIETG